jgi:hypothetical protein
MNFLIIIKDISQKSKNTLQIGAKIANAFSANLSIVHIGKKSKALIEGEVRLAQKSMAEWNILHPGTEVLQWAYESLKEFDTVEIDETIKFEPKNLKEEHNRFIMNLPQSSGCNVDLILREGKLIEELAYEVDEYSYELAIIGCPKKKRNIHKIIQFIDTSIFLVKNFREDWDYNMQLCVDDSRSTKRAVVFGTRISKHYKKNMKLLTVSKTNSFKKGYRNAHRWAVRYLQRMGVKFDSLLISGDPVDVFISEAGDDHIIIMGKAKGNEFFKYFKGSKPIHTAQKANCPILIIN